MGSVRLAAVGGVAALAAMAATPVLAAPQEAPPVFGADVRVVAVPVFVTDKDGKAISGLTAQDFEIEDGGRVVPVAGFLAVDAGAPPAPDGGSRRLMAASRRQFLLLFDLTFSNSSGIMKARKAALDLLEKGPQPGDLVAVASFGQGGVSIRLGFTPDRAQAARAVATLESAEGARLRDPLGLAYDLGFNAQPGAAAFGLEIQPAGSSRTAAAAAEAGRDQTLQLARANRAAYGQQVGGYLGELQKLAQLLDSVDGRKQVILLSGGFDQSVLMGAQGTEQANNANAVTEGRLWEVTTESHFGDSSARSVMDGVFSALARSDSVVHTVDIGGLTSSVSVEEGAASIPKGSGRESLAELAGRSGGRFVKDTNDLAGALRDVLDASRYYYVLAFEPADSKKKPGELHKLKVKVKRAGLEVSHRSGYTLPDPKTVAAQTVQMQSAEAIAKGLSGGALRLRAAAVPYRDSRGRISLPVVLEIDGETLVAGAGKKALPLEVYAYALDGDGRIQDALGLTPTLDLEKLGASIRQKGVQFLTSFRVRTGTADLRFLVRDPATGRTGSLRITSPVPAFSDGLVLSPPLLMDDPRARLVIPSPSRANPDLEIPFRLEDAPFTLQPGPVLKNGDAREVCLMTWGGAASSKVSAALVGSDGRELALEAGSPRLVRDADRFQRYVVSLTPKGIPAGDYRLRLTLQDPSGSGDKQSELAVRVN